MALAKRYLSYFDGRRGEPGAAPDQELLRELIPEQRKRVYEVRRVLDTLFDEGSVLELRDGFGAGMLTALARVDGRPLGVLANDPTHLGGAIDADGADKAARFLQLCDAFELPVLFLCDTPGFMVGPEAERTATVRHFARMFLGGANLSVPTGTIVLRKGYGLGAQAMAGGGFKAPLFTVAWPTSEFGGMGLEGAVRLGMRRELEAIEDEQERERVFEQMVAAAYERGRGLNMAAYGEIDDVIDPADSRRWIATLFDETRRRVVATGRARSAPRSTPGEPRDDPPAVLTPAAPEPPPGNIVDAQQSTPCGARSATLARPGALVHCSRLLGTQQAPRPALRGGRGVPLGRSERSAPAPGVCEVAHTCPQRAREAARACIIRHRPPTSAARGGPEAAAP